MILRALLQRTLLAGTIKAREASDAAERVTKGDSKKGHHFSFLNEPKNKQESEGDSLGSGELFDAPKGPPTAKPLLAAAIKAREQADAVERAEKNETSKLDGSASDDGSCESSSEADKTKSSKSPAPGPMEREGEADDSSLSSGEADELNELLDRQDNGEEIDEDRLYELDLFDKWRGGDELDDEEQADVGAFKDKRRSERRRRREFQDLLDKRENGEDVDEDRLYFLELLARQHLGEELKEDELLDLEDFENEEKEKVAVAKASAKAQASDGSEDEGI
jgi:hypothetical protein